MHNDTLWTYFIDLLMFSILLEDERFFGYPYVWNHFSFLSQVEIVLSSSRTSTESESQLLLLNLLLNSNIHANWLLTLLISWNIYMWQMLIPFGTIKTFLTPTDRNTPPGHLTRKRKLMRPSTSSCRQPHSHRPWFSWGTSTTLTSAGKFIQPGTRSPGGSCRASKITS